MKKTTLKPYLITLLVLLLCFGLMLTAFACNQTAETTEDDTDTEEASTYDSLVSNGDFSSYNDGTQPYSPKEWSDYKPSGYSDENKIAGVIDTGADYQKNSADWGDAPNPFGAVTDNKVLMVYNKEANAYGYTNTFSADPAVRYYSISAKIKVTAEVGGATFWVSSDNGKYLFKSIATTESFTTYTFYLLSPTVKSTTITVGLSLGYEGDKVQGYAFFDDVMVKKITEKEYNDAVAGDTVKKVSMLYPDGEFNYYSYSTSTDLHTPTAWSAAIGTTTDKDHTLQKVGGKTLSTSDIKKGIISLNDWNVDTYGTAPDLYDAAREDKNVLMLSSPKKDGSEYTPTAFYYYSKNKIRFEMAKIYQISVWVKATVDYENSADKGARVVLKGTDTYSSAVINTTGKQTDNAGWVEVIFYVLGNQFHDKDFEIQLWFGNDKDSTGLMQGTIFFDNLTVVEKGTFTEDQRADLEETYKTNVDAKDINVVNLVSKEDNLIVNNNFDTDFDESGNLVGYEFAAVEDVKTKDDVIVKIISKNTLDNWTDEDKTTYGIETSPLYPSAALSPVLLINNTIPSAYQMKTVNPEDDETKCYAIEQSQCYRLSVWLKTVDLSKTITLKVVDEKDSEIGGEGQMSFSEIDTKDYVNAFTNDYVEYSFYFKGAMPVLASSTTNSNYVRVVLTIGSGNTYDPSSFVKGAVLVANVNMEKITYTEYSSATSGNYLKKHDYSSSSGTVSNGNFNYYDMENTEIGDDGFVAMSDKDGNTHLVAGIADWTNNVDSRYGTTKSDAIEDNKASFTLTKGNTEPEDAKTLIGKTPSTVKISGEGYDKTFESDSDWNKIITINPFTNKISWAVTSNSYNRTLTKTLSNNETNYFLFSEDLTGKVIESITMTASDSDFKKEWKNETEWENYIRRDAATNRWYWVDNETVAALEDRTYNVKLTVWTWSTTTSNKDISFKKTEKDNDKNDFVIDLENREILQVKISGSNSFSKSFTSAEDWSKYLTFTYNETEKKWKGTWANTEEVTALANETYTLTIVTDFKPGNYYVTVYYDQKETNNLIAGIINVNASQEYLDQFGLTQNEIYNKWSEGNQEEVFDKDYKFGAPNLLMLTTRGEATVSLNNTTDKDDSKNNMTKTPAVKSSTVSLDANSTYLFKCYARSIGDAVGEIYVSTTSSDQTLLSHTVKDTDGWMEYNFMVETGLSSVNAAFEIYYGEKGNEETSYKGTLLFDSFSYKKLSEKESEELAEDPDTYKNQKFTVITFDSDSAKEGAAAPSGLNAQGSSSKNDDTQVSGVIAKNNYAYTKDGKSTLGIYETVKETDESGNETSKEQLKEGTSLDKDYIFNPDAMEGAEIGDYLLMVNNLKDTYQAYYMSSLSLESESYYSFSAYVRTAFIEKDAYARVYVKLSDEPIVFKVNTEYDAKGNVIEGNPWQKFTFYFKNEKTASETVSLYFELGENTDEGKMKGYLFVDNVSLSKIDEAEFNEAVYEKTESGEFKLNDEGKKILLSDTDETFNLNNIVTILTPDEETDDNDDTDDEEEEESGTKLDTTLLWTYITSIVIAVILIAVIVVLLIKKYRRPKNGADADAKKATYDRSNAKSDAKSDKKSGSARDEFKD